MVRKPVVSPPAAPPTVRQLEQMQHYLKQCQFIETAAALSGVRRKDLVDWIRRGRAGHAEYVPFVQMLDLENAKLADWLMQPIRKQVEEGNVQAAQWLYKVRVQPHEERFLKKQFEFEDELEAIQTPEVAMSDEDVAAAEARVLSDMADEVKH